MSGIKRSVRNPTGEIMTIIVKGLVIELKKLVYFNIIINSLILYNEITMIYLIFKNYLLSYVKNTARYFQ